MGGAVESIEEVRTPRVGVVELVKGSKVPYAAIHEYGGNAGRAGSVSIPRRSYLRPALRDETSYLTSNLRERIQQAISVI
jgi:phage gpG-like protein